jgi:hypothetical protein
MLVAVATPIFGVVNTGDVARATTVPDPVVLYDVPHADPVEFAIPAAGYVIVNDALIVWLGQDPVIVTFVPATSAGVAVPDPPCPTDSGVVRPVNDVMSELAPDAAAPVTVCVAFHAVAPVALNVPSAGVEWVIVTAIFEPY